MWWFHELGRSSHDVPLGHHPGLWVVDLVGQAIEIGPSTGSRVHGANEKAPCVVWLVSLLSRDQLGYSLSQHIFTDLARSTDGCQRGDSQQRF